MVGPDIISTAMKPNNQKTKLAQAAIRLGEGAIDLTQRARLQSDLNYGAHLMHLASIYQRTAFKLLARAQAL